LHHSQSLKEMLQKMGGIVRTPQKMLQEYEAELPKSVAQNQFLSMVHYYLTQNVPKFKEIDKTVVHGDVNYQNWLVCRNYLYLVDWDSVMFADPAVDIGTILGHYLPISSWNHWLMSYGIQGSSENLEKVYWYALLSMLQEVKKYYNRNEFKKMNQEILQLKRIYTG